MRDSRRKLLSQNFLWNRELVKKLIRGSSISKKDTVLDIGAGSGAISDQVRLFCGNLIAVEADRRFFQLLVQKYKADNRVSVLFGDFRQLPLPAKPYKVFSNIPFSITGEIIKKLLLSENPPLDCNIVVQKEAAEKFMASNRQNSMLSILLFPWFELRVVHEFCRDDFRPIPKVDPVLVRITQREYPLIERCNQTPYRDYVTYHFTRARLAKHRSPKEWTRRLADFMKSGDEKMKRKVKGSFDRWLADERKLAKIHRTRFGSSPLNRRRKGLGAGFERDPLGGIDKTGQL